MRKRIGRRKVLIKINENHVKKALNWTDKVVKSCGTRLAGSEGSSKAMEMISSGGMPIITVKHKKWYSYTIGDFFTEAEAEDFKKSKQLNDAKVVKFKNGKPL